MPDSTSTGRPRPQRRRAPAQRPLAHTPGPDAATPLAEVRLTAGVIVGAHGVEGELKLRLTTDDPDHLRRVRRVFLGDAEMATRVKGIRFHKGMALLRLTGVTTPEQATELTGTPIRISGKDARPLEPNEYYLYQVTGLSVRDETGIELGTVTDILQTGANDVFVVTPSTSGAPMLLPSIPEVILDLQPQAGFMVVRPLVYYGDEESTPSDEEPEGPPTSP